MNGHIKRIIIIAMLACVLWGGTVFISGLVRAESTAPSNTILVDTLEDGQDHPGNCSLREAITSAVNNVPTDACLAGSETFTDTIEFSVNGTIQLTTPLVVGAGGPVLIDGGGTITLSGHSAVRVFTTTLDTKLTMESLGVALGSADKGAGIYNTGRLVLSDTAVITNTAYLYGGGIYNIGNLSVANSSLTSNSVNGLVCGGGIYNEGALSIKNSTHTKNSGYSCGGGVSNQNGSAIITGSIIFENHAGSSGGGISNVQGSMDFADNILQGNSTSWGNGGAIYNQDADLTVICNTITDNNADFSGGEIYNWKPITLY